MPAYYDKEGYLDAKEIYREYRRIVSFGLDDELLIKTFKYFFEKINISCNYFYLKNPSVDEVADIFAELIFNGKVVVCNGIAAGLKYPRTFDFKIIETNENYRWKEASHSYVLIGYDLDKRYFIAADNYGSVSNPYVPCFRHISFEDLYNEITLINKNNLDKSYYMMKKSPINK